MKLELRPLAENVSEATAACIFMMVQGNVLIVTTSHWLIASQTGFAAGTIATVALLVLGQKRRCIVAVVLGLVTGIVDSLVHDGPLADVLVEALLTGLGATLLSLAVGALLRRHRKRSRPAAPQ